MASGLERRMAALDIAADGIDRMSMLRRLQEPPEVGSLFFARAGHLVDPHNFYVIPKKSEEIIPFIVQPGLKCLQSDLEPGIIVIYKTNDTYRRGLIREVTNNKYKIFAMDHGCEEDNIGIENIFKPLLGEALLAPPLALHCELYLCEPRGPVFTEDAIAAFKHFMGAPNELLKITVKYMNAIKLKVVVNNSNPDDLATILAITDFTQFVRVLPRAEPRQLPQPPNSFPWKHKHLKVGDKLKVRIQCGSSFSDIFVCTLDDHKDYLRTRADFTNYCKLRKELSEQDMVLGMPVGVLDSQFTMYERGHIERVLSPGHEVQVRLVDWGKLVTVTKDKLRPIQTEFWSLTPIRAYYCCAMNGQRFVDKLPATLCKGYMYKMTVRRMGREFNKPYMVTLESDM